MFGKPCSCPWVRTNVPVKTTYTYLWIISIFIYDLWHFSKRINGNSSRTAISSCVLRDPPTLLIFPNHYKFLTAHVLAGQHGQGQSSFICGLAIFQWSHASEKQHLNCVSSICGKGLFFVTLMLVTNSWLYFCLLPVISTYLFLLGTITHQQRDYVLSLQRGHLHLGDVHSSILSLDASPHTVWMLLSEFSLITAVSQHSPLFLHHSLCQWDAGNCSCLSATHLLSGLVSQENAATVLQMSNASAWVKASR